MRIYNRGLRIIMKWPDLKMKHLNQKFTTARVSIINQPI